jgi:putative transcription factor
MMMSLSRKSVYCEICGREIPEISAFKIFVEGSMVIVCPTCYAKYVAKRKEESVNIRSRMISSTKVSNRSQGQRSLSNTSVTRSSLQRRASPNMSLKNVERYEIDPSYPEIIRKAREAKNMTIKDLALRLRESENIIKRIEAGRLTPSIELARKIEEVLGVKIIVTRVEDIDREVRISKESSEKDLMLGDLITVKRKNIDK